MARERRLTRRELLRRLGAGALGVAAWVACGGGDEQPVGTTLQRTVRLDPEGNLVYGAGEPYVVRTDLAQAQAGRETRRRSLVVFHHLSDFRIVDEESPLRSEWVELCERPVTTGAFRPHESLSTQAADALIAQANAITSSPVTRQAVQFAIHTGNAIDNAQFNELRWFVDLMDGKPVYPDAGAIGYQGVQLESPDPAYGDLLARAQRQFTPVGLRVPWYAVVGNHDVLVQGNFPRTDQENQFAIGAQKIMAIGPDAAAEVCGDPEVLIGSDSSAAVFNDPRTVIRGVGSDGNRRLLTKAEWIAEHFGTEPSPGPEGHGFSVEAAQSGTGYYVLERGLISFIVLDTTNPGGFSAGSIDAAQFAWLEEQLTARSRTYTDAQGQPVLSGGQDRLIVIASHHPVEAMTNPFPGVVPDEERLRGEELEAMLHRFPNVVLHIAGHTGQQRIEAKPSSAGGYWQVTTGSPQDFPMQGRLLEIVDNRDGTLSVFSTVYDSAAPLNPGDGKDPTEADDNNQALLAGVARRLAVSDPQRDPAGAGLAPSDRNAELLIAAPFDVAAAITPPARE